MAETAAGSSLEGPLEVHRFPEQLTARVVAPGPSPRVHGYDVAGDLCRHYDFVDLFLLYLVGELPGALEGAAAKVALMFVSPLTVAHASVHSAVLARLCGGPASAIFGVAAVGVAEQARFELSSVSELLEWLSKPELPMPEQYRAQTADEKAATSRLIELLPKGYQLPIAGQRPAPIALVLAILHSAGLRRLEQFEAALAFARLPSALAEAFAERPVNFGQYPINLPPIHYREPDVER